MNKVKNIEMHAGYYSAHIDAAGFVLISFKSQISPLLRPKSGGDILNQQIGTKM